MDSKDLGLVLNEPIELSILTQSSASELNKRVLGSRSLSKCKFLLIILPSDELDEYKSQSNIIYLTNTFNNQLFKI